MTLDEAIKHAEEVAEEKDLEYSKLDWKYEASKCFKCAEEHRQLAEWLKELKQLRKRIRWILANERLSKSAGVYTDKMDRQEESNYIKDLSERVENIEKQMKEDREEQLKKLEAELNYTKFRRALYI